MLSHVHNSYCIVERRWIIPKLECETVQIVGCSAQGLEPRIPETWDWNFLNRKSLIRGILVRNPNSKLQGRNKIAMRVTDLSDIKLNQWMLKSSVFFKQAIPFPLFSLSEPKIAHQSSAKKLSRVEKSWESLWLLPDQWILIMCSITKESFWIYIFVKFRMYLGNMNLSLERKATSWHKKYVSKKKISLYTSSKPPPLQ